MIYTADCGLKSTVLLSSSLAAWALDCFALKGPQSRQVEEFSFRVLACFY